MARKKKPVVHKRAKTVRIKITAGRHLRRGFGPRVLISVGIIAYFLGLFSGVVLPSAEFQGGIVWSAENTQTASAHIAAVRSDGVGLITTLIVEVGPGTGRVLIDTHPLVGFDFQYADRIAVKVASKITGYALDDDGEGLKGANVFFYVSTQTGGAVEVQAIDGPSAGAATTVATIAVLENKKVKDNVIITGTINEDGSIGPVGEVFEKAQAANENGAELFLVPRGQSVVTVYNKVVQQVGPFQWVTYEPEQIDLNEYAENESWGIRIQEVSTIENVIELMLE